MFDNAMKRLVIGLIALALIGFGLVNWVVFGDRSSFQTWLSQFQGLPATASDIAVYQQRNISGEFVAYFRIAESNFVAFAAASIPVG